jgi:predicted transcriptional regulator
MGSMGLTPNELMIFAVIHSFTENGRGYDGGLAYLAEWVGCTARSVNNAVKHLVDAGWIVKSKPSKGRVSCLYLSNHEKISGLREEKFSGLTMKNFHGWNEIFSYDKKDKINIDTPLYPPKGGSENADAKPGERKRPPRRKPPRALNHIHGDCSYSDEELKRMGISTGQEFYDDYKDSLTELRIE